MPAPDKQLETQKLPGSAKQGYCSDCNMSSLCLPTGLTEAEIVQLDQLTGDRLNLKKGQYLFHKNTPFDALFAVRTGCIESYSLDAEGNQQILGFYFRGEVLGFDAIYNGSQNNNAFALEDSQICLIPFNKIRDLAAKIPGLLTQILRLMSREITHDLRTLRQQSAEARVAGFLLKMVSSLGKQSCHIQSLILPMSRKDFANYLQLAPETASRILSKFQEMRVIEVSGRNLQVNNIKLLEQFARANL